MIHTLLNLAFPTMTAAFDETLLLGRIGKSNSFAASVMQGRAR